MRRPIASVGRGGGGGSEAVGAADGGEGNGDCICVCVCVCICVCICVCGGGGGGGERCAIGGICWRGAENDVSEAIGEPGDSGDTGGAPSPTENRPLDHTVDCTICSTRSGMPVLASAASAKISGNGSAGRLLLTKNGFGGYGCCCCCCCCCCCRTIASSVRAPASCVSSAWMRCRAARLA